MKLTKILFFAALLALVSCSNKSKNADAEMAESESVSQDADFIVDADSEELLVDEETSPSMAESSSDEMSDAEMVSSAPEIEMIGDVAEYTVAKGETLMMVSFKVYGDYRKWKEIRSFNGLDSNIVSEGTVIKYQKPSQEFVWNPEGLPYLIKNGDSLVSISNDKYGTPNKWNYIYDNNKPLIRDPNLIFAGFTLYYIPEDREIASEF